MNIEKEKVCKGFFKFKIDKNQYAIVLCGSKLFSLKSYTKGKMVYTCKKCGKDLIFED